MKSKGRLRIPEISIPLWWPSLPIHWRGWLPSKGNVVFTLLIVVGLFWAQSAGAVPLGAPAAAGTSTGTVAYQGRLADASGNPVTATVPMIFRLYSAASGGAGLWEEQWTGPSSVRVSDGLFNVMLGSLTAIPQSVVTSNANLWLGITVNADNEMQPRVQLGSVPFAVQALTVPDGSITKAKLAPGLFGETVSTLKLPNLVGTTSSATADFGTVTLASPSNVFITGQWVINNNTTAAGMRANLVVDGTNYGLSGDFFPMPQAGIGYTFFPSYYIPNLAAGTHTFSVVIGQGPFRTNDAVYINTGSIMWVRVVPTQ